MRKRRQGEINCTCSAYGFPHRMMGGNCNGGAYVEAVFESRRGCSNCHFAESHRCEVLDGRDSLQQCPELQEFIRYHSIKIYGVNRE